MFSMGNTEPRPYSRTLASAGISCVVVTNTLTQLGLGTKATLCQTQRHNQAIPGVMGELEQNLGVVSAGSWGEVSVRSRVLYDLAGRPSGGVMTGDNVAASGLRLPSLGMQWGGSFLIHSFMCF